MRINQLIRDLKFAVNSETHTNEEWQTILQQLQEVGNKANIRLQMQNGNFLETIEDEPEATED